MHARHLLVRHDTAMQSIAVGSSMLEGPGSRERALQQVCSLMSPPASVSGALRDSAAAATHLLQRRRGAAAGMNARGRQPMRGRLCAGDMAGGAQPAGQVAWSARWARRAARLTSMAA